MVVVVSNPSKAAANSCHKEYPPTFLRNAKHKCKLKDTLNRISVDTLGIQNFGELGFSS